jgi:hypothetical protein
VQRGIVSQRRFGEGHRALKLTIRWSIEHIVLQAARRQAK